MKQAVRVFLAAILLPVPIYPAPPDKNPTSDRPPAVAGKFYPADKAVLAETVDRLLLNAQPHPVNGKLLALLVPHAEFAHSGPIAAEGYKSINPGVKTFVIIGPSHQDQEPAAAALYARGSFSTPLGEVPVDESVTAELMENRKLFVDLPEIHASEHSIEVQLPFLQRVFSDFKIVPILLNTQYPETAWRVGDAVARAIAGKNAVIIISSDLAGYPPKQTARRIDQTFLHALQRIDPFYLMTTFRWLMTREEPGLKTCACGISALMAGLSAAKALGANNVEVWRDSHSGEPAADADKNNDGLEGYATVAFTHTDNPPTKPPLDEATRGFLLSAARTSIEDIFNKKLFALAPLADDPILNVPTAVFVTLRVDGKRRGCFGSDEPPLGLQDAVRYYARADAYEDKRFAPLELKELDAARIQIEILSQPKQISSRNPIDEIAQGSDGVIVKKDDKSGLYLPEAWQQFANKEDFLKALCQEKAGLPPDCWIRPDLKGITFSVFRTEVFSDEGKH